MSVINMKVTCQYCALEFEEDEIEKHQFECVSSYQNSSINFENKIPCEICNELIDFEKYNDHLNICSQPTASIPLLFSRFNTGSPNLLNLLNLPNPPNNTDNIDNNEDQNTNEVDNIEESIDNLNAEEPTNIEDNSNETTNSTTLNHNFDYNVNLINYNINLINHLLRNSQFRNTQNVDSYESYTVLDDSVVKVGLEMDKVSSSIELTEQTKCPICLDDFENGTQFRKVKCNHLFCEECLEDWLEENKKCPVCMNELE